MRPADSGTISRAVAAYDYRWPSNLTDGIMYFEGSRITREQFEAEVRRTR